MEAIIDLVDLIGPYKGRIRPYVKHAAEHAIASGFARLPVPSDFEAEPVAEAETKLASVAETEAEPAAPEPAPRRPRRKR